jgi:hypothetical protein
MAERDPVIAPPGPRPARPAVAEALFAAARRRRRRRLAWAACCLVLAASAAAGLMAGWPRHDARQPAAGTGVPRPAPDVTLPAVRMAWVDYGGQLHLGNLASRDQHVVATVDASPADPMIRAGGHLYWADSNAGAAPIRDYDIATGRIRYLARGDSVFASADRRHIFIAQGATKLIELPAGGTGRPRLLALPAGWRLSGGLGNWSVAGGIVSYSGPADERRGRPAVGVWNPGTGQVKIIGRALDVLDTVTPPGASYSLLAWSSGCLRRCQLGITNTSTLARVTVRSPGRYGFTYGGPFSSGAFSPDGRHLAVFLNTTDPQDPSGLPYSELAIASTRTGALRLVPAVRLVTTEDVGWARWLPGGRLLAGAESGSYAVNTQTLAAWPFSFSGSPGQDITSSGDINFSATVLRAP